MITNVKSFPSLMIPLISPLPKWIFDEAKKLTTYIELHNFQINSGRFVKYTDGLQEDNYREAAKTDY